MAYRLGLRDFVYFLRARSLTHKYQRLGIQVDGRIDLGELGVDERLGNEYAPTGWRTLLKILDRCQIQGGSDVFLDVGSGKGQVLLAAARYRFRRIIGIEISEQLNGVAQANLRRANGTLKCRDIVTHVCNATAYEIPDDVTVIYFQNSFGPDVLRQFLQQVKDSAQRKPRALTLVCNLPIGFADSYLVLAEQEWLRKTSELFLLPEAPGRKCVFYKNIFSPQGVAATSQ
jgi:SAM-dependent methyltransferase